VESLQFGGRPVTGFGVGAAPDADAGIAALQAAVTPTSALAALQAAGHIFFVATQYSRQVK
jgi:hypothetical protein